MSTASVQVVRGMEVGLRIRVEKLVDPRVLLLRCVLVIVWLRVCCYASQATEVPQNHSRFWKVSESDEDRTVGCIALPSNPILRSIRLGRLGRSSMLVD